MLHTILTVVLATAPMQMGPPAPPDIVATAFADAPVSPTSGTPAPVPLAPQVPPTGSLSGPTLAGALLLALAAAAFWLLAKKRSLVTGSRIRVLENMPLGARRSLVLARIGDEVLLLGSSEAGIAVLSTKPSSAFAPDQEPAPVATAQTLLSRQPFSVSGVLGNLAARIQTWKADMLRAAAKRVQQAAQAASPVPTTAPATVAPAVHATPVVVPVAAVAVVAAAAPVKPVAREPETAFDSALRAAGEDQELQAKLASMLGATAG